MSRKCQRHLLQYTHLVPSQSHMQAQRPSCQICQREEPQVAVETSLQILMLALSNRRITSVPTPNPCNSGVRQRSLL